MSIIGTGFSNIQDGVADALGRFTPRDRYLIVGLGVTVICSGLLMSVLAADRTIQGLESEVVNQRQTLDNLSVLLSDHVQAVEKAQEIETTLAESSSTDLSAFLEQSAESTGVSDRLNSVNEKSTSSDGVLEEKLYAVSLSKLQLEELAGFLWEIESASFPLQIQTLKVKTRKVAGEITLRLDMDVSAFSLIEPTGGEG